jgi:polysaccharide biosynthesis protein PslH
LNILYITPYKFIKPNAGGKFAMHQQIKYLSLKENVVVIGVDNNEKDETLNCVFENILPNKSSRYFNLFLIKKIKAIVNKHKSEIIILEHPYYAWLLFALKKICNVKVYIRSQNVEYLRFKDLGKWWWPILRIYEKWAHNISDGVLCITEDDKLFFKNQGVTSKLIDFPFGTSMQKSADDNAACKNILLHEHNLESNTKLILFNGTLNYLPNQTGLDIILNEVNPYLQKHFSNYKIIICGSQLPEKYNQLKDIANIIYCGFVDDIATVFKGVDVFINPVQGGGGIKTKLVDALSFGTTAISSVDGAKGLVAKAAGEKLIITPDFDGKTMAKEIIKYLNLNTNTATPNSYYEYYNWQKIVERVVNDIK